MIKKISAILLVVLIAALFIAGCGGKQAQEPSKSGQSGQAEKKSSNLEESLKADSIVAGLKADDGQLLLPPLEKKEVPPRPADPAKLPEDDAMHWYDMEYSGWGVSKVNIPKSPKDGAKGKKVILIVHGDHPWTTAYIRGAKKVADAYGMELKVMSPNFNADVQAQMVDQAIGARPDMILMIPVDAKMSVQLFRKINQAGIPVIATNTHPESEAMKYVIAWTGPDDWGQFRMLAQKFAELMHNEGGYAIIQHNPGGSPFFARTYAPITELKKIAPKMELLDKQAPGFEAEKTMQVVSDWITRFGSKLKGIILADDSAQAIGTAEAIKKANRQDIIVVAAGNSKVGMDLVKEGKIQAITYQTAEGDGAAAVKAAADWFNGKDVEPVRYLPKHIITKDDVDKFMPAQW
ncbi:Periplasmic binding protein-like I [Moorella glycerini]|uniref:D-ribose transporter subunit RbsB n=1 Tax=Neomoorella stamsii TaxID=1266720 RepID=A0A9X7P4J4_9FIRM|nr:MULTISPECIES: sugar ABC transporter substrate-binding protein [Moorella]PRR68635.1 D-ribose transporter subunit RbsB [Moorella stamsii]CEP69026.1 Periplasmic binding protein-like I [Moorella glycerini]